MRPHRSHSQLNSFLHCGHQYYLTRVKHYPEVPSVYLASGKAFHAVTEDFDELYGNDAEALAVQGEHRVEWYDAFTEAFDAELELGLAVEPDMSKWNLAGRVTKEKPDKESALFWHEFGRELVDKYITWRLDTCTKWDIATMPDGELGIEVEMKMPVGGVPMKGYIDRVLRDRESGQLAVTDLKTGSRTPASPMQLALYSVQLEELVQEPVVWGAWYDARKGQMSQPIDLSLWTKGKLGAVYNNLDRAITAGIFIPNIDTHCSGCSVRDLCVYQGGREPQQEAIAA